MTLRNRLSLFFLATVGLVLAGLCASLYVSIRFYLHRQLQDRLESALSILAGAAEIHPQGIEWEPQWRALPLGQESGPERLRWMVHDDQGRRIDHSRNLVDANLTREWVPRRPDGHVPVRLTDRQARHWQAAQRRIVRGMAVAGSPVAGSEVPDRDLPGVLYPALILTVCAPSDPVDQTVAAIGGMLIGLSLCVWLVAAALARSLLQRALAPLTRMVESARGLDATDVGWSVEEPGTGDELDDLGRAFNDLLARLRLEYERQRRFSSDASHQLRTPVTALIGQIELALKRERPREEYRDVLHVLHRRTVQLGQIVEALLFLGRADAQAGLVDSEPLELRCFVEEHLAAGLGPNQTTDVACDDRTDGPLRVRVHPPLLGQLLDNLLENARKYGPPGAPPVVRIQRDGETAALTVIDAGPGIDPQDLPHLFEPFYRTAHARRLGRPGVGLGLAVAQRIALAFGGTIRVRSAPGCGSEFEVRLPAVKPPPPAHSAVERDCVATLPGLSTTAV